MLKIGIFFGGKSREREVSFAGGRTVYDSLDKTIFQPIAIFVDGFGNFIELDWQYVYKGTIRDFFPPAKFTDQSPNNFQIYSESLGEKAQDDALLNSVGKLLNPSRLNKTIDFAFLALHGPYGEDGSLQGLLDFYNIPYSGSGIYSSAVGISKALQKQLMETGGFKINRFITFTRFEFDKDAKQCFEATKALNYPVVIKASSQGSSIGVHFLDDPNFDDFKNIVNQSFFRKSLEKESWNKKSESQKIEWIKDTCDLQHGLGLPLLMNGIEVFNPDKLLNALNKWPNEDSTIVFESIYAEPEIVVEEKLTGKEFSCIVLRDENGKVVALPPTEIRKARALFDYRAKYLPGITRKVTPIEVPDTQIQGIRLACSQLFSFFKFNVYARIDGFITEDAQIFLNDPNTTSGMMPSSFFFHQAAEIGLSPTQFLSYIIHQSLVERSQQSFQPNKTLQTKNKLDELLAKSKTKTDEKTTVGVFFGGYSSERHISVESGRNVFEKLSSSGNYNVLPIFLTQTESGELKLYHVPINILLKDNADDIKDKIAHFKIAEIIGQIISEGQSITSKFTASDYDFFPKELSLAQLPELIDFAFMALHGRPGEDGTLSREFEKLGIAYNGSGPDSAALTIDKYQTNENLSAGGVLTARHSIVSKSDWQKSPTDFCSQILNEFQFPFIAKPTDDGCSSAVKKIDSSQELINFSKAIFRDQSALPNELADQLELKPNEEFPVKERFLIEDLIGKNDALRFLEITGGMLSKINAEGEMEFEVFEASEAVAGEGILSLEEKFLAGEGQNLTPARYGSSPEENAKISTAVKKELEKTARLAHVEGYCRIDAFVRIYNPDHVEVVVIEINSLPGLTPATAIFHQAAIAGYKPYEFLNGIIEYGLKRKQLASAD